MNTKAIYFKDGSSLAISKKEAEDIIFCMKNGDKFVEFQSEFVSIDSISRIGRHKTSADVKKYNESTVEMNLLQSGRKDLVEEKKRITKERAIEKKSKDNVLIGNDYINWVEQSKDIKELPQSNDEAMRGEPAYYLDKNGEKMYS